MQGARDADLTEVMKANTAELIAALSLTKCVWSRQYHQYVTHFRQDDFTLAKGNSVTSRRACLP